MGRDRIPDDELAAQDDHIGTNEEKQHPVDRKSCP
jgi:hypothetical protein